MREIKFRAWDTKRNRWYASAFGPFDWEYEDTDWNGGEKPSFTQTRYPDGIELMQYTGLKDRNGKEVYEGDIISSHFEKTNQYEAYTEVGVVNITPYRTEIEDRKHGKYNSFYSHSEVIGNIYENPELLVKK